LCESGGVGLLGANAGPGGHLLRRSGYFAGHAAARLVTSADEAQARLAAERYGQQVDNVLGAEMRASGTLMNLFAHHPGLVHTALTRLPPAWRRLDAYIAGRTSVARIMTPPLARAAALASRALVRRSGRGPVNGVLAVHEAGLDVLHSDHFGDILDHCGAVAGQTDVRNVEGVCGGGMGG
jgi:hypothetical protein